MAPDQNNYQTKVSLHQQVVTHLKSTQIRKISEAVWDWLNTTWPYSPQVSMYAIISVTFTLHLLWSLLWCPISTLSEVQLLVQVENPVFVCYIKPWGGWILTSQAQKLHYCRFSYVAQLSLNSHKYGGKCTVPCIETKTVATTIVQCNY